jgi:hypothetical protein
MLEQFINTELSDICEWVKSDCEEDGCTCGVVETLNTCCNYGDVSSCNDGKITVYEEDTPVNKKCK